MKILKIIVVILLVVANGILVFVASLGGEGVAPVGELQFANSYPEFGAEAVTFAPSATHAWAGAIEGGIAGNATDIEKAIYLFMLASYNERDIPYYAYYLDANGYVKDEATNIEGDLLVQTYRIVNNILIDNIEIVYHRVINFANKLKFTKFDLTAAARLLLNDAKQELTVGNVKYKVLSPGKDMSLLDSEDSEHPRIGVIWQTHNRSQKEYDGKVEDWEEIDITDMSEEEIEFAYRYEWRSYINFLNPKIVESATIEQKSMGGNMYWKCQIVADIPVVNKDAKTIAGLIKSAGFDNMDFNKYILDFEVWDIGVFKFINTEESWNGSLPIPLLDGVRLPTQSYAPCYYSYDPEDCDITALLPSFGLCLEQLG